MTKRTTKTISRELTDQLDAIAATPLFQCFKKEELIGLLAGLRYSLQQFQKGKIIHMKNDPYRSADLILEGKVGLQSSDPEGNILSVHHLASGEMIGTGLLFASDNRYPVTVVTETNVTILRLNKDSILLLCSRNTEFTHALFREVSDRALTMAGRMHTFAYQSIRRRLSDYLKREYQTQQSRTLQLPVSKKQIAEQFGIQPQSLSRELHKMRDEGLLDYHHRTIQLNHAFFK